MKKGVSMAVQEVQSGSKAKGERVKKSNVDFFT